MKWQSFETTTENQEHLQCYMKTQHS